MLTVRVSDFFFPFAFEGCSDRSITQDTPDNLLSHLIGILCIIGSFQYFISPARTYMLPHVAHRACVTLVKEVSYFCLDTITSDEDKETAAHRRECWRVDQDNEPTVGPEGADEQD
jgi:hypothetical protein